MNSICFRFVLCALLAATAFAITACSSSPEVKEEDDTSELVVDTGPDVQEIFAQASDALDAEQWDRAARLYGEVVDADPHRWDAHMNRGIALVRTLEFDAAIDSFEMALRNGGDDEPIVYFNLGNLYQERGLYESAINAYRASMAVTGALDYDTLLNISACFTFLNAYDKARLTIDRALELDPDDPRAFVSLGILEFAEERPEDSLQIFEELLASHPDLPPAHYNRGYVLMRMEKDHEALDAFETYLNVAPDGPYVTQSESHIMAIENRLER